MSMRRGRLGAWHQPGPNYPSQVHAADARASGKSGAGSQGPGRPTEHRIRMGRLLVGAVLALGLVLTGCAAADNSSSSTAPVTPTAATTTPSDAPASTPPQTDRDTPNQAAKPPSAALKPLSAVDGDTVKLPNGQSVRVIGIDTPERGECGYGEATALTAATIAEGAALKKAPGHENTDRYDRLLRYVVNASGTDLGTRLLKAGLATARYDSRDGYDRHPNEDKYHKIDNRTPHQCGNTGTAATPQQGARNSGNDSGGRGQKCDPNYGGVCVPLSDTDLDCGDLTGAVTIKGSDPHGFDGDGDGRGCE
ncbi:MAG: thermonuclease family protein [Actinomycetia bacterium]|nr:thermonuclease family protein [Actinomycetes bacterium]